MSQVIQHDFLGKAAVRAPQRKLLPQAPLAGSLAIQPEGIQSSPRTDCFERLASRAPVIQKPVAFGARRPGFSVTDGIRLRRVEWNTPFTNDEGKVYRLRDIADYVVRHYREYDGKAGPANYYQGSANAQRNYRSMFWYGLDRDLGFRTSATQDPLINALLDNYILWDMSDENAPAKIELTKEAIQSYKDLYMPTEVKEKLDKMGQRTGGMFDSDASKVQEYAEWVNGLPWGIETEDRTDLAQGKQLFEDKFYGMEAIKKKVLAKIATRQLKGKNRGGIILLVGPGGTGKTAIAETIAEVLGRQYERVSLAGVGDAHDLLGFLYTYQGSKPGSIIECMKKAGSMNPVIQIDEMDKVPSQAGPSGSPRDALLAILDPDQNYRFKDRYINLPVDLSKVLFICTANSIKDFPEHLLSRTDVIQVPMYLEAEKLVIGKKHLFPKQLATLNLPKEKVVLEDEALQRVIRNYTKEGGVRKLSARLMELAEYAGEIYLKQTPAERAAAPPVGVIKITKEMVSEILSDPVPDVGSVQNVSKVGSVNGLYYSVIGGGVIPIKSAIMPGNGQLILTGNLGKVMQESARVALSYILANATRLGVSAEMARKVAERQVDIHIQYLDSNSEKDGPSAGLSTFLTLYSAMTGRAVPQDIGLTGEISLDGAVLPVGGMLEKISGAAYQGVKAVYIPKGNEVQVKQESERSSAFKALLQTIQIKPVATLDELVSSLGLLPSP